MFFKTKKIEEEQEMCPETASLFTKLHNIPYLKTHRGAFVIYWLLTLLKNMITFAAISMIAGLAFTDVALALKAFLGG